MRNLVKYKVTAFALVALFACCEPADAKKRSRAHPNLVRISYQVPKDPAHQEIYQLTKERGVLERFREMLSPVRFPRPLRLAFESCDGVANAYFEDDKVTVCYEYIAELVQNAPATETPAGVTRKDAVVGPTIEVFLHEIGHAVFDMLEVPLFGREEDAADQFAAYVILQLSEAEAKMTIRGISYMYAREARDQTPGFKQFADAHGLPAQRLVNVLCLAYGARPEYGADALRLGLLPQSRADGCADEYQQVHFAFRKLIHRHVDVVRAKKLARKQWIR